MHTRGVVIVKTDIKTNDLIFYDNIDTRTNKNYD